MKHRNIYNDGSVTVCNCGVVQQDDAPLGVIIHDDDIHLCEFVSINAKAHTYDELGRVRDKLAACLSQVSAIIEGMEQLHAVRRWTRYDSSVN